MTISGLKSIHRNNLATIQRRAVSEISGSLGDLGTFLPLAVALTVNHTISLPTTLICTGIYNILTGVYFGIPLPVQPMKAIAAVAIANNFTGGQIAAAGIFVGGCISIFSATGLLHWFSNVIPIPVVKGIQVGAGLSLIIASGGKLLASLSWTDPSWSDNYIWALLAFLFLMFVNNFPRTPYALIVFTIGIVLALIQVSTHHALPHFEFWRPYVFTPCGEDWRIGIFDAGIGQLPLTTLNSVIAVVHLSADLLPEIATPAISHVGLSVGAMNLLGCWFGAMPVCHGSGGLAAQYRFGARSGASIIFLGAVKLIVGLFFGESLVNLLKRFPSALLGIMVIAAGLELASVGESLNTERARDIGPKHEAFAAPNAAPGNATGEEAVETGLLHFATSTVGRAEVTMSLTDVERKRRWAVMFTTVGFLVAFKNDAVGFLAGMACHWSFKTPELWETGRRRVRRWCERRHRLQISSDSRPVQDPYFD